MAGAPIEPQRDGDWLNLWLARPEARNALSGEMIDALMAVLNDAAADATLRGITLRGRGPVFCAGGDLKGFARNLDDAEAAAAIELASRAAGRLFQRIASMPQAVIVVAHGAAMAGGLGVVCAADIAIVTRDTRFALTETQLGIVPAQIAPLVVARTGIAAARRLMLTGARFAGDEARALGIADEVVAEGELDGAAARWRAQVLGCAPGANAATKALLRRLPAADIDAFIDDAARCFRERLLSDEGREGMRAFAEKRAPDWKP